MRLKLYFQLENSKIPIDYRRNLISFLKLALSNYGEEYFKKFYNERDNIIKNYTFSVFFPRPKIDSEHITIEERKFELNLSIADYENAIILYNALNGQKNKKFSIYRNSWCLTNIEMVNERQIEVEDITVKFISPLCVRSRIDNKDFYYSFSYKEFEEILKINIKEQLKITKFDEEILQDFRIIPINAKKVIVKFYEKQIETSTGTFKIHGNVELLNYLYRAGIGSKRSARFWDVSSYLIRRWKFENKVIFEGMVL